ncbi:unnamed protein product [Rotaria socialis]|uniref:protein-disulfide reductase n=1 Tax=Rotaria socialis TaxID=392032 RepID=A0A820IHU6_9BILA|nr:unnamed protein product [Rotaria socialis]
MLFFIEQTRADEIKSNYDVRTIPELVILSPTGEVLYSNCINEVSGEGAEFFRQWYCVKEKPTKTIVKVETTTTKAVTTTVFIELLGEQLLQHSVDESSQTTTYMPTSKLEGKTVGLYFSGHWCQPSREFTVKLAEAYKNAYEYVDGKFEIVFVSWDNEENAYENFYNEMPWKALPFTGSSILITGIWFRYVIMKVTPSFLSQKSYDPRTHPPIILMAHGRYKLIDHFLFFGIPSLIILSAAGEIITSNGVEEVYNNGADFFQQLSQGKCPLL